MNNKGNVLSSSQKLLLAVIGWLLLGGTMKAIVDLPVVSFVLSASAMMIFVGFVIIIVGSVITAGAILIAPSKVEDFLKTRAQTVRTILTAVTPSATPSATSAATPPATPSATSAATPPATP